ncbi:SDR family NAD(P)-dependent oxidoreductase [Haloarchaeobius litoreus]|uniref:SDR family NAD(P)-dependent oxidoreductase n=1 Tax=Haloarchaeobius litoreus TaxID=755306 RepID=A0ABD6DRT9_9EURY|nr:SDR family oxidoreductase [Haloarchaeobius litoreus]
MSLLDDEIAVITGGSSGIGRGIALAFAEHGAKAVVVADVREDPKEEGIPTHEKIETETDADAAFVHCDVTDREDLTAAMDAADEFGGVSIMVNNAGVWRAEDFFDVSEEEYRWLMDINLYGAFFGSQVAAERMVEGDGGSIINISSIAGLFGNGNWPTYSASKGGLTMLTYSLAHTLAEHDIRVNAIHPGGIETKIGGDQESSEEEAAVFAQQVPLGRYGQPEEIGGAATFLASDLASYITGESLVVDGGWTSWR